MTDRKPTDPGNPLPSAEDLRMRMLEREMAEMEKQETAKKQAAQEHSSFTKEFLTKHFTEHERDTVLRLIRVAVEQGKTEALIYSFLPIFAPTAAAPSTMRCRNGRTRFKARHGNSTIAMWRSPSHAATSSRR